MGASFRYYASTLSPEQQELIDQRTLELGHEPAWHEIHEILMARPRLHGAPVRGGNSTVAPVPTSRSPSPPGIR
jgi:hypothetical protein